jgi:hypothetical protein
MAAAGVGLASRGIGRPNTRSVNSSADGQERRAYVQVKATHRFWRSAAYRDKMPGRDGLID